MFEKNRILQMLEQNQIPLGMQCFTGDPILFGKAKIWVKHFPSIQDFDPTSPRMDWAAENGPALAFGELRNLAVEKEGSSLK